MPIKQKTHKISPADQAEITRQTEEMLKMRITKRSIFSWASPVVLVTKKDKTQRFCVDFKKLNAVTRPELFLLPKFDTVVDAMANKQPKVFSIIDMRNGFCK